MPTRIVVAATRGHTYLPYCSWLGRVSFSRAVDEATLQRVGSALRRMGEDLVAERRRVMILTRENQALREQLEELKRAVAATNPAPAGVNVNTVDPEA